MRSVYSGLAIVHGDLVETIGALTSTDGLEMRITEAIGRLTERVSVLLALEEDIAVRLYFSGELAALNPGLQALPAAVGGIVEELNGSYFGRLAFTAVDPSVSGLDPMDALRLQLTPLGFRTADGEGSLRVRRHRPVLGREDTDAQPDRDHAAGRPRGRPRDDPAVGRQHAQGPARQPA